MLPLLFLPLVNFTSNQPEANSALLLNKPYTGSQDISMFKEQANFS